MADKISIVNVIKYVDEFKKGKEREDRKVTPLTPDNGSVIPLTSEDERKPKWFENKDIKPWNIDPTIIY